MTFDDITEAYCRINEAVKIVPEAQSKAAKNAVSRTQKILLRSVQISEGSTLSFPRWATEKANQLKNEQSQRLTQ